MIKIFEQFRLFVAKIEKIVHTWNSKDAKHSNRHNFISVHDIDTIFACIVGFSGSMNSNMLSKISTEAKELPQQPSLGINKPKLHGFLFCARNRGQRSKVKVMAYKVMYQLSLIHI